MKKVLLSILCLLAVLLTAAAVTASAADVVDSGDCGASGSSLTWSLDSDGRLTISGSGNMDRYKEEWPWDRYRDQIITVSIEPGVHEIGSICNGFPKLAEVKLSSSVYYNYIDNYSAGFRAFRECPELTEINVESGNRNFSSHDGALYTRDMSRLLLCPSGKRSLTIADGATTIYNRSINDCPQLEEIRIPNSVKEISTLLMGTEFTGCPNLKRIDVAEDNPTFSSLDGVLYQNGLSDLMYCPAGKTGLTIPAETERIYFIPTSNQLQNITVEQGNAICSSVKGFLCSKDGTTLNQCPGGRTGELTVPDGITTISSHAFAHCTGLTKVTIPDSVTEIKSEAFEGCTGLTEIDLPDSIAEIGYSAFQNCTGLKSVAIPEGVTTMKEWFRDCTGLTSVTFSSNMEKIWWYSFYNCTALTDVYYVGSEEEWDAFQPDIDPGYNEALLGAKVHFVPDYYEPGDSPILSAELTGGDSPALTARLFYEGADPASVCFAFYDGSGRQLGAELMDLPRDQGLTRTLPAPAGTAGAKVFVWNADGFRPLCPAVPAGTGAAR